MARTKATLPNIDKSSPAYLEGRVKDNTGAGGGTPVNEYVYGDIHQFFAKLMHLYKIPYNGLPDNENTEYQLVEAVKALASKNDYELSLSISGGTLILPVKISALQTGETFIAKAVSDKDQETTVKGSLDNSTKAASFTGDFKAGEYVLVVNRQNSVEFIRMVNASNLKTVALAEKFLLAATQTEEDTGETEEKATTPKSNKVVFSKRVIGDQSANYLASETRNGLLSKEDKKIINEIGSSRVRNVGYFAGLDVDGMTVNDPLVTGGQITSAIVKSQSSEANAIEVTFENAMDNNDYKLQISVESQGDFDVDNNINPVVWKVGNTTTATVFLEETTNEQQNLKIHIDVIQL